MKQVNVHLSPYYYYAAAISTGIAALTVVLQWIGQGYKRYWNILFVIRNTSIILGNSHDKTVGKTMVLLWSWRNNSVDYPVGYDTGSKSDYKRKSIINQFYEYRHRAV